MRSVLLVLLLWVFPVPSGAVLSGEALGWADLLRRQEDLVFTPREIRLPLTHRFIQFGSEVLEEADTTLVRNRDYGIDYGRGVVFLLASPSSDRRIRVTYLHLPGPSQRSYRATEILSPEEALTEPTSSDRPSPAGDPRPVRDLALPGTLHLTGSKTIGVSFGQNREATIDQSLRIEVAGELARDLRVTAVLSDDNLPVRPEGNTEELGDLNKVFMEVQGPVVGGVLGDYQLERKDGEFIAMRRELRGGEARFRLGRQELALGAGLARGELQTTRFRGQEGRQGPYELLSARRLNLSTVLPGSERVYLDGGLLRRGEGQDYVIDYDRGELRFTSRQRITADSEISVDFEVSTERYRRTTRTTRLERRTDRVGFEFFVFEERDERDHPVEGPLRPEDVTALVGSGDGPAILSGIRPVELGEGLYRYGDPDSSSVVYDPVAGDLIVQFFETGRGGGSYEDSLEVATGRRFFRFVGPGQGSFEIGRLLLPPDRMRLASGRLRAGTPGGVHLAAEASLSAFDANLFSDLGDDDNTGDALDMRFETGNRELGQAGRFGFSAHVSQLSPRFRFPGQGRPAFYYKEWNAETDTLRGRERLGETTIHYTQGNERPWLRVDANLGRLARSGDLMTDRGQLDLALGGSTERNVRVRLQRLETERPRLGAGGGRRRRFASGEARYRFGFLQPELRFETDDFERADADSFVRSSYRYIDTRYRMGLVEFRSTSATLEFGRRDTDARAASRRNETYALHVRSRPASAWQTEFSLSRRTNEPRHDTPSPTTRSDLAIATLSWAPTKRRARAEWRYEISEETVRTLQQVLVLAPDGRGDFDAEGRSLGRDQGLYDKVFRFSGETERTKQVEAALRLELGGRGYFGVQDTTTGWFRRNVSLVQILSVTEQTRSDRLRDLYLLVPSAYQTDQTVFGTFQARQQWSLWNASKRRAARVFLDWQADQDGRFTGSSVRIVRRGATLRYDRTGRQRFSMGGEIGIGDRKRRGPLGAAVPGRPASDSHDVRIGRVLGRASFRISPSERLACDLEWTSQRDRLSGIRQQLVSLTPQATLAPLPALRLFGSVGVTRVLEKRQAELLAPFFFDAPGTRSTVSLTGSYRLGRNLNMNLTYTSLRNTDGRSSYDVKAESRAVF